MEDLEARIAAFYELLKAAGGDDALWEQRFGPEPNRMSLSDPAGWASPGKGSTYTTTGTTPTPDMEMALAEIEPVIDLRSISAGECAEAEAEAIALKAGAFTILCEDAQAIAQFLRRAPETIVRMARAIRALEARVNLAGVFAEHPELVEQVQLLTRIHGANLSGLAGKDCPDRDLINDRE